MKSVGLEPTTQSQLYVALSTINHEVTSWTFIFVLFERVRWKTFLTVVIVYSYKVVFHEVTL